MRTKTLSSRINELRGVGKPGWIGAARILAEPLPHLWPSFEKYFPGGLTNSLGEPVTDLTEDCCSRDIYGSALHARWVECPDRSHQCYLMDRNNPAWREYLKAVIRIQIDAGVDGIQLDEAELPLTSLQYGGCFCKDCMAAFRAVSAGAARGRNARAAARHGSLHLPLWRMAAGAGL